MSARFLADRPAVGTRVRVTERFAFIEAAREVIGAGV